MNGSGATPGSGASGNAPSTGGSNGVGASNGSGGIGDSSGGAGASAGSDATGGMSSGGVGDETGGAGGAPAVDECSGDPCADVCTCDDTPSDAPVCTCLLTQSSSNTITPLNSVNCNNGVAHAENSFYRIFDLSDFGIDADFSATSVEIGFEFAESGLDSQSASIRFHELDGTFTLANLTSIATNPIQIATTDEPGLQTFSVNGTLPPDQPFVLELLLPDGQSVGNYIQVGSNSAAQSDPTYIRAPSCGYPAPASLSVVGFPDMHWVVAVIGTYTPN
jgi:hypothetical protein